MKVQTIQQKYNQLIKEKIFKQLKKNSEQKKQLRLLCIQNEFKILKSTFFNWQLAYLRKQREAKIEQKGYNKYLKKFKKKLFLMLQLNLMIVKENRNKYSQAKLFYEKSILKKSLHLLRLNEVASKQTFLEKMKRIDEQDQIYQNCQQSMRQNLIAEAFYKQQLLLKYLRKWKQCIFKINSHCNSYNLGKKLNVIDLNDDEKDKKQNQTNKQSKQDDINQLLECKIQFYEKNKQLLSLYQKEIIKKEIKELLQKKNV